VVDAALLSRMRFRLGADEPLRRPFRLQTPPNRAMCVGVLTVLRVGARVLPALVCCLLPSCTCCCAH